MKQILFCACACLLMAVGATAQVTQIDFTNYGAVPARINGVIQVSAFDYNVPSQGAASFASWNSFSNGCSVSVPGYGSIVPFSASASVKVNDLTTPANTETITPTLVTNAAPVCS